MSSDSPSPGKTQFAPSEPLAERLTHMLVAMATELAVTHERVDTLERALAKAGALEPHNPENPDLDAEADEARRQWRESFLDRIFEHLQAEITTAQHSNSLGGPE